MDPHQSVYRACSGRVQVEILMVKWHGHLRLYLLKPYMRELLVITQPKDTMYLFLCIYFQENGRVIKLVKA